MGSMIASWNSDSIFPVKERCVAKTNGATQEIMYHSGEDISSMQHATVTTSAPTPTSPNANTCATIAPDAIIASAAPATAIEGSSVDASKGACFTLPSAACVCSPVCDALKGQLLLDLDVSDAAEVKGQLLLVFDIDLVDFSLPSLSGESGPGTSGDSSRCAIMGPRLRGGHLTSSRTALLMPVTSLPARRRRSPSGATMALMVKLELRCKVSIPGR
mmetsp:Transcript_28023/g.23502  ORF Transcript_28023/g.23502 Transcript_28023/m.23502 type:complete len:217 (-) Transcript_28023:14-664(-)